MVSPPKPLAEAAQRAKQVLSGGGGGGDDEDDDIMTDDNTCLSLRDPISGVLIETPARSVECSGLACFDLDTFIEMNSRSRKWTCPHCMKSARVDQLVVDSYIRRICEELRADGEDCTDVEIQPNGSWRAIPDGGPATGPWRTVDAAADAPRHATGAPTGAVKCEAGAAPLPASFGVDAAAPGGGSASAPAPQKPPAAEVDVIELLDSSDEDEADDGENDDGEEEEEEEWRRAAPQTFGGPSLAAGPSTSVLGSVLDASAPPSGVFALGRLGGGETSFPSISRSPLTPTALRFRVGPKPPVTNPWPAQGGTASAYASQHATGFAADRRNLSQNPDAFSRAGFAQGPPRTPSALASSRQSYVSHTTARPVGSGNPVFGAPRAAPRSEDVEVIDLGDDSS